MHPGGVERGVVLPGELLDGNWELPMSSAGVQSEAGGSAIHQQDGPPLPGMSASVRGPPRKAAGPGEGCDVFPRGRARSHPGTVAGCSCVIGSVCERCPHSARWQPVRKVPSVGDPRRKAAHQRLRPGESSPGCGRQRGPSPGDLTSFPPLASNTCRAKGWK